MAYLSNPDALRWKTAWELGPGCRQCLFVVIGSSKRRYLGLAWLDPVGQAQIRPLLRHHW